MRKKTNFLAGAALGAAIGTVAALLLAPKSGKKTRDDIKKLAKEMSNKIVTEVDKVKRMSKKRYEDIVDNVVDEYKKKKKAADRTLEDMRGELKSKWKDVEKELKKR